MHVTISNWTQANSILVPTKDRMTSPQPQTQNDKFMLYTQFVNNQSANYNIDETLYVSF